MKASPKVKNGLSKFLHSPLPHRTELRGNPGAPFLRDSLVHVPRCSKRKGHGGGVQALCWLSHQRLASPHLLKSQQFSVWKSEFAKHRE